MVMDFRRWTISLSGASPLSRGSELSGQLLTECCNGLLQIYIQPTIHARAALGRIAMSNLYKVERIVGKKISEKNQVLYKVKWVGYPDAQNTWEPVKHLRAVQDMIEAFEKKNEKKLAEILGNSQYHKTKNDSSKPKQREALEPKPVEARPPVKLGRPRKLIKGSEPSGEREGERSGKSRSDQDKGSQLQDYYVGKPGTSPSEEEEGIGELSLSFLEARIRELAEQKEEERLRIVGMFKGKDGEFTYEVLRGKQRSVQSRDYILEHCPDELVSFYESRIQFQEHTD